MKSVIKFWAWPVLAALLCFAPYSLGQSADRSQSAVPGPALVRQPVIHFGGSNACSSSDWSGSRDDRGWGSEKGGRCAPVPEGGPALMYVLLAGLCCSGAMVLRSRRPAGMREAR
jgi:hypothetical protein